MENTIKQIYLAPNQKVITCRTPHREPPQDDGLIGAINRLSGNAFKLYSYIARNQNGYTFALSGKEINFITGMGAKAYRNSVQELIRGGYLSQDHIFKKRYTFYTNPQEIQG